jgi:hypothetical protein
MMLSTSPLSADLMKMPGGRQVDAFNNAKQWRIYRLCRANDASCLAQPAIDYSTGRPPDHVVISMKDLSLAYHIQCKQARDDLFF